MSRPEIINLDDFRPPKQASALPCKIVFIFQPFRYRDRLYEITVVQACLDGAFPDAIQRVREQGGLHADLRGHGNWFLPWPCAAVKIEPLTAGEKERLHGAGSPPLHVLFRFSPVSP